MPKHGEIILKLTNLLTQAVYIRQPNLFILSGVALSGSVSDSTCLDSSRLLLLPPVRSYGSPPEPSEGSSTPACT